MPSVGFPGARVTFTWGNRSLADARATIEKYQGLVQRRRQEGEADYLQLDPDLGWRNVCSSVHPRWPYSTNALGNRRSSHDNTIPAAPKCTIAITGNSYVHGDESTDEDTWVWQLQDRMGSDALIHNLGTTAYSTDQSYLRLREFSSDNHLDLAVLTITSTDVFRNLNMCRAFMMNDYEVPLYKPRFVESGDRLELIKPPDVGLDELATCLDDAAVLGHLKRYDYYFPTLAFQAFQVMRRFRIPVRDVWPRYFHDGINLTTAICKDFASWARAESMTPVILLLPVFWGAFPAGRDFDVLTDRLNGTAHLIDARLAFTTERRALPRDVLHHRFNHYTRLSGGWLAETIGARLEHILADVEHAATRQNVQFSGADERSS